MMPETAWVYSTDPGAGTARPAQEKSAANRVPACTLPESPTAGRCNIETRAIITVKLSIEARIDGSDKTDAAGPGRLKG